MKKLTSKILLAVLSIVFWGNDTQGEIITLITTEAKNFDSDPIDVEEGQVLKVLHVKKGPVETRLNLKKDGVGFKYVIPRETYANNSYAKSGLDFVYQNNHNGTAAAVPLFSNLIFQGPLTFSISSAGNSSLVTVEVTSNDYGAGSGNNVTVIPDSTDNATLVLEGSDDMVNWTVETLGEKPKANRKKFYRLRAKKD